ncbi:MAG: flavodoxin family protein [Clostridia bacterium]|nr:flavodoxin family protein [Clostridia bacterium]
MNIVVIFGSPHKNGPTHKALCKILDYIPEKKSISFFDAYKIAAHPCVDCGFCEKNFSCKYDDLNELYQKLTLCDLLILAFPIYNASFPSPMKCIMDRLQPLYYARNSVITKPKNAVIITAQGSPGKNYEECISDQIAPNLKLLNIKNLHFFSVKNTDNSDFDIDNFFAKSENKIKDIIKKIYNPDNYL